MARTSKQYLIEVNKVSDWLNRFFLCMQKDQKGKWGETRRFRTEDTMLQIRESRPGKVWRQSAAWFLEI